MPTYSVTICPLRLSAHFCRPGGVYTVLISRRGVEIPTRPVVCNGSNEVVFADAEDINQCRSFEVSFDSPKDRRTLAFGIYDFTNRKNPAKLTGFEIPLAGMCSVLAGESMCESKGISFRVAGHPGKLDVIFRMHPLGTPVPALRAPAARKDSNVDGGDGGDGGSGDQRATRLPTAALQALIKAGIMPTSVGALEMDVDLANEIAARTAILFPDKENLRAQIETLEKEVIRMEYDMKYGMKDAVASGSAAASALVNEHDYWKKKMEDIQEKSAHEAGLGPKLPPGASALPPQTQRAIAEVEKEMEENRAAMLKLDALQTKRDVTQDAMKLLRRGEELEAKLMKLKTSPNTNANGAASMGFDAAATGDHFDRLAGRLYDAEAGMEEVRQVVLALNGIQFSPYPAGTETGFTHEVPKELAFIAENHRRPQNLPPTLGGGAASAAPAAATKVTSPHANVLDDLFGGPSTNAAPTSPPPPPTKPLGDGGATISTLFEDGVYAGAPATKVAPVWQATDQQQQQQQQQQPDSPAELQEPHASPVFMSGNHTQGTFQASAIPEQPPTTMHGERGHLSPPPPSQPPMDYAQMQLEQMKRQQDEEKRRIVEKQQVQAASTTPHFERRPPTQDVIPFTSFPGIPLVVSACPIDVYLDGTTPTRGTEMSFINHADHQILIAGIELKQEDVFSPDPSSAKTVLTRRWPEQLQIPGASTRDSCIIALHSSFPRGTSLMMLVTVYLYEGDGKYSDHTTRLSV